MFNVASRWWGNVNANERIEIDVIAESMDRKTLLVGECKWTNSNYAERLFTHLTEQAQKLPFIQKYSKIVPVLFLKEKPKDKTDGLVFLPEDILKIIE